MLEKVVFKISRNLTAGSEELLFNFLKEVKKLNVKVEKEDILKSLQKIIEAKPQMAVFYKAMEIFAKENDDVKNVIDKPVEAPMEKPPLVTVTIPEIKTEKKPL
ncbi:MAG: hypothetical protein ABIM36_05240, partial [candidate division WOR-3 bacterium]